MKKKIWLETPAKAGLSGCDAFLVERIAPGARSSGRNVGHGMDAGEEYIMSPRELALVIAAAREEGEKKWRDAVESITYRSSFYPGEIYFSFVEATDIADMLPDNGAAIHIGDT